MNERIEELARKVGLPTYNPEGLPTKLEKFAELIIQECITEINLCRCSNRSVPYEKLDLFDQGEAQAVSCAIDAIKHNFGV
jgi:hypothetical protein